MSTVGFIGLGNMGAHMARNLAKAGHRIVVFDMNKKIVDQFKAEGAEIASSPADVAVAAKEIVTMLPSSPHVREVYTGKQGLVELVGSKGTTGVTMVGSTIDQSASIEVSKAVLSKSSVYLDTPVSGGVVGAQNATLTFMVGGASDDANLFARAKGLLEKMGKNIVDCGSVGTGQAAKICNNMLLGIEMIGVAETMNLGLKVIDSWADLKLFEEGSTKHIIVSEASRLGPLNRILHGFYDKEEILNVIFQMGLDAQKLAGIINTSSGRCWSSDTYNPVPGVIEGLPCSRGYEGGFGSALMAKDLSLAQNAATTVGAPTPLGSLAHQIYRILAQHPDFQSKDFGVVYKFLKNNQ